MANDRTYDEEGLADLLGLLRPAPSAWVRGAQELPFARAEIDGIVRLAEDDASFRTQLRTDLERALRDAGYEPNAALVAAVRAHLLEHRN